MKENWYIILGLEFDPDPVTDEEVIKKIIRDKRKEWSNPSNHGRHPEYKKYVQSISKIEEEMIGPKNIRAELISDACEKTYGPIDEALKNIKDVEISEDALDVIAKNNKTHTDIVKKRAEKLGFKIVKSKKEEYQKLYDEYYSKQPEGADKYKIQDTKLKFFHVNNLYEFLYGPEEEKKARKYSCEQLCQKAKDKDKTDFVKSDAQGGTGKQLCTFCGDCFKNENSKKEYDKYLCYYERRKLLDNFKQSYEISLKVTGETYSSCLSELEELEELLDNKESAADVLEAFCIIERIPIPSGDGVSVENNPNIKICACGVVNDISDKRKFCKSCGLDLQIRCPKCGTLNDNNVNVCSKCGGTIENVVKALQECMKASKYIEGKNLNDARKSLAEATKLWPDCDRLPALNKELNNLDIELTGKKGIQDADNYLMRGEYSKYEYLMRELEEKSPKEANIRLADLYINLTRNGTDRSGDLIECSRKLKRMKAKEAYYFLGIYEINRRNIKGGKKQLNTFISKCENDSSRDGWNGNDYELTAKWNYASATLEYPKSSLKDLKNAEECYRTVINEAEKRPNFSREAKEKLYAEHNSIKNVVKKKKQKMIKNAVTLVVIAVFVVLVGGFIIKKSKEQEEIRRQQAIKDAEAAALAAERAEQEAAAEAARISIADYTISDDMDVDSMECHEIDHIEASSELVDTGGNVYGATKMTDLNPSTSWQESESGGGEGSTIDITLDEVSGLNGISFMLGSHRSEENYGKNNRPKTLAITINGESCDYSFEDTFCWHTIVFDKTIETDAVHIEIKEVYKGSKWDDTCIAELRLLK